MGPYNIYKMAQVRISYDYRWIFLKLSNTPTIKTVDATKQKIFKGDPIFRACI